MLFPLTITKVDEVLFEGTAENATLPGVDGELTILADHEPLIAQLGPGTITVRSDGEPQTFLINGGILETSGDSAVVLIAE